ncbi:Recombinase [Mycolicibacterium rhodesiae JS60]|nr:Recombinase [Mycolicibacterium rhodesiae JS60]
MPTPQVRAIVGARVSKVQGLEKTSHLTQRDKGEAYAESQGWSVVGTFEDLDVSAIKLSPWDRPDLKQWLSDRPDEWDALIFAKTDRVFRSANDCVTLAEWCKNNRKILVLVDDGIKLDYFSPEDAKDAFAGAMSKVFLILASVFAEIEGQRFLQRARDRVAFIKQTDRWGQGNPPFGYQIIKHPSGKGKALDLDPETQKILHRIAAELLDGRSLMSIATRLNKDGVLSPLGHYRKRTGSDKGTDMRWTTSRVKWVLSRPIVQGLKMYKGKVVLDGDGEPVRVGPPSFDDEAWNQIQTELEKRSTGPRRKMFTSNPLLGVAKCRICGGNMQQVIKKNDDLTYRYYVCTRRPSPCPRVLVNADAAEELVSERFLAAHSQRRVKEKVWQAGSDHSAELEQTIATIESLREDRALGLFTSEADQQMYRQQMAALVAKRDALAELPVIKSGWIDVDTDRTYADVWETASVDEKRKMLTDAGAVLWVTNRNDYDTGDFDALLGEGDTGKEFLASTVLEQL